MTGRKESQCPAAVAATQKIERDGILNVALDAIPHRPGAEFLVNAGPEQKLNRFVRFLDFVSLGGEALLLVPDHFQTDLALHLVGQAAENQFFGKAPDQLRTELLVDLLEHHPFQRAKRDRFRHLHQVARADV